MRPLQAFAADAVLHRNQTALPPLMTLTADRCDGPLLPFSVNCMLQCRVAKPAAHVRRSDPCCSMSLMQKNLPFITAELG